MVPVRWSLWLSHKPCSWVNWASASGTCPVKLLPWRSRPVSSVSSPRVAGIVTVKPCIDRIRHWRLWSCGSQRIVRGKWRAHIFQNVRSDCMCKPWNTSPFIFWLLIHTRSVILNFCGSNEMDRLLGQQPNCARTTNWLVPWLHHLHPHRQGVKLILLVVSCLDYFCLFNLIAYFVLLLKKTISNPQWAPGIVISSFPNQSSRIMRQHGRSQGKQAGREKCPNEYLFICTNGITFGLLL